MPKGRRKHVPMRTCVGCGLKHPKRQMLRIVRTPEDAIELDVKGKRPGRGTYMCTGRECREVALDPRKLSRALKGKVTQEDVQRLRAEASAVLDTEDRE